MNKSFCIFTGSNPGVSPLFTEATIKLAKLLVARNIRIIYGGANIGLMGTLANTALQAGGEVIGVIPSSLVDKELAHPNLTQLNIVETMHERKALMGQLADAFIALPGGIGTLEELFEAWDWNRIGIYQKPCGLLNIANYYDSLLTFLQQAVSAKFLKPHHYAALHVATDSKTLVDQLLNSSEAPVALEY